MSRKVSIQTLADQLGLSKYAVSRALSGKSGVSEATRSRVLELARASGYRTSIAMAKPDNQESPDDNREASFVLICMKQQNRGEPNYWERVLSGMLAACEERGWLHAIVSPPQELSPADVPAEQLIAPHVHWDQCIGIIVMGAFPYPLLQRMADIQLPLVLVDHQEPLLQCDTVRHDDVNAGSTASTFLQSQHCRRIGFITDDGRSASFLQRRIGVQLGVGGDFLQQGTTLLEWQVPYERGHWGDEVLKSLEQIPEDERPDGWIGANDDIALEWMETLQKHGYSIPEDCRVIGIDNVWGASLSAPPLTTIQLSKEELGARAIEALERRLHRPGAPVETIMLSTRLIPRKSA
ncbi:LacI family DNA-binding transcriptional regulator [Paenibacillus sp. F411]|uniref:LacI family DNA-binding transcriptional regulator n=1 Tax=Paenibacillus sp. F411 TaxID=2820239 RepID=UPI001AAE6423|nr:LacI family DNA-binding transcriptional regulator [Paenibacillus sp. F411]MBO2944274.1 LacI family DNA-binding transcriptional regulator [Paenibacillus sp. F411]